MKRAAKEEMRAFGLAVRFLTRLPAPASEAYSPERLAASVRRYPLVGGHTIMRLALERGLRGYTGDTLGAVQQASEIGLYLGVLASVDG